jgi:hypothetical protein
VLSSEIMAKNRHVGLIPIGDKRITSISTLECNVDRSPPVLEIFSLMRSTYHPLEDLKKKRRTLSSLKSFALQKISRMASDSGFDVVST